MSVLFEDFGVNNDVLNYIPPRKLNIQKAIDFTASSGGYSNIDNQTLDLIKYPPLFPPIVSYGTDNNKKTNNIRSKQFQFSAQYSYDDGEESRWSPFSRIAMPDLPEAMDGEIVGADAEDNYIAVGVSSGHETVTKIRVAYREGNIGQWYVFREVDKDIESVPDGININIPFYGDTRIKAVAISEENYDAVPLVSGTMEFLHKNVIALGNNLRNYDRLPINVSLAYQRVDTDPVYDPVSLTYSGGGTAPLYEFDSNSLGGYFIPAGTRFIFVFTVGSAEPYLFEYIQAADYAGSDDLAFRTALKAAIDAEAITNLDVDLTAPPSFPDGIRFSSALLDVSVSITVQSSNKRIRSFKTGADHDFCIQYYDRANRDGTALKSETSRIYVKTPMEETLDQVGDIADRRAKAIEMTMTINHTPPKFATHYQILYRGNSTMLDWQQRTVRKAEVDSTANGRIRLSLETYYESNYSGASIKHEIKNGDVVRILRNRRGPSGSDEPFYLDGVNTFTVFNYDPIGGEDGGEAVWINSFDFFSVDRR